MDKIEKKHHIGKPRDDRSIIVKFVSCRHRALGYAKSKNLKTYNQNEMNDHKSFIEDSLLRQRIDLLFTNKRFYKKPFDSVWTHTMGGLNMVSLFSRLNIYFSTTSYYFIKKCIIQFVIYILHFICITFDFIEKAYICIACCLI